MSRYERESLKLQREANEKLGSIWDQLDRLETLIRETTAYPRHVEIVADRSRHVRSM